MSHSISQSRTRSIGLFASAALLLSGSSPASAQSSTSTEASDLAVASVRTVLKQQRALIAADPKDPKPYIELAYMLSDAGMGAEAKEAAARATRAAPESAFAFSAQAWILHQNIIGVDFGKGFDYDASIHSYQQAIELDPKDLDIRASFADLLRRNRQGIDYGPGAQLPLAIDAYRYVKQHESPLQADTIENLGIALFYAGRYEEALNELAYPIDTAKHQGLILAAVAAWKGSDTAIAAANKIPGDIQRRKDALNTAAEGLWNMRLYAQAADLMTASLPDAAEGPAISARIQLFKQLKTSKVVELPASDPRRPVQRLMVAMITGALNDALLNETLSHNSYASGAAWEAASRDQDQFAGIFAALTRETGLPRIVLTDILLDRMNITANPAGPGSDVNVQILGRPPVPFFVLPEKGVFKIVSTGRNDAEVGTQAIYLLKQQRPAEAASLLSWKRNLGQPPSSDSDSNSEDLLGGSLFRRLWNPRAKNSPQTALLAAASLIDDSATLKPLVPDLMTTHQGIPAADPYFDLLLATVYLQIKDAPNATTVSTRLLKQYPDSITALRLAGQSYGLAADWTAWKALLTPRLHDHPTDHSLLLESAAEAEAEGDFNRARTVYRTLLNSGHAKPADYNTDAWLSLFQDKVDDQAITEAQQASLGEGNKNYTFLYTLACLNAAHGNTAEAHQELLDAMSVSYLEQPNAAIWLGFGLIFEQYGEKPAAIAAYRKAISSVEPGSPSIPQDRSPINSQALAHLRLKALGAG